MVTRNKRSAKQPSILDGVSFTESNQLVRKLLLDPDITPPLVTLGEEDFAFAAAVACLRASKLKLRATCLDRCIPSQQVLNVRDLLHNIDANAELLPLDLNPDDLVSEFLRSASKVQRPDGHVFIGISTHPSYIGRYDLARLMEQAEEAGYECLGLDRETIYEVLAYGYRHQAHNENIHQFIWDHRATIVFRTRGEDVAEDFVKVFRDMAL
ncbi:hypothetical protein HKX48_006768 [Thoreauomyces humboldtii]|nr:hypothetical protein HKX48_006768 [Thoreauomyces humboldtii]